MIETEEKTQTIICYHGTSLDNAQSIEQTSFRLSQGRDEWLGDGIYFFTEGISQSPLEDAKQWAIAQAWNDRLQNYNYKNYAILKAAIQYRESKILDLTSNEGLRIFNYFRDQALDKLSNIHKRFKNKDYRDSDIINYIRRKTINFAVVKANVYIRFKVQRLGKFISHLPNVTILSVVPDEFTHISFKEIIYQDTIE